jgi:general secretion pathway protein B
VLPTVWDLPYATRKDLPDLSLTMHVYADDPHQRFVVIKGDRHVEGDDLGSGVTLREIRADGMVLEFKGQRFVYPRDGR